MENLCQVYTALEEEWTGKQRSALSVVFRSIPDTVAKFILLA